MNKFREFSEILLGAAERLSVLLERAIGQVFTCFMILFFSVAVAVMAANLKMTQLEAGALTLMGGAGGVIFAVIRPSEKHPKEESSASGTESKTGAA